MSTRKLHIFIIFLLILNLALLGYSNIRDLLNKEIIETRNIKLYETNTHLIDNNVKTYNEYKTNSDEDYSIIEYNHTLRKGDFVFIPNIGMCVVSDLDDNKFNISDVPEGSIYNGMSGIRVLSADMRYVVGFISRVENGKLVVLRSSL